MMCAYRFSWWISHPEGNHLVIWPFDHLPTDQCCLARAYLLPVPRGHGRPLRMLGLATLCHTEGTSAERWISTVTAGTASWQRALGLRMQTAGLFHLTEKREDGARGKETERDWLDVTRLQRRSLGQSCDGTLHTHSGPQMCRWWEWILIGLASLTSRCGEQHVNVMMWAAYHRLLFGNHGVASITISIISMTSVLNGFVQNTDKSNMLISFIQIGHLQSVRGWIKKIKYRK